MKRIQHRTSVQPLSRGEQEAEYVYLGLVLQKDNQTELLLEIEKDMSPVVKRPFEVGVKLPGLPC